MGSVSEIAHRIVYVPHCVMMGEPDTEVCNCPVYGRYLKSTLPPEFQQDERTLYAALDNMTGLERVRATVALENLVAEITETHKNAAS